MSCTPFLQSVSCAQKCCVISDVTDVKSWRRRKILFCEFVRRLCLGKVSKYEGASLNFWISIFCAQKCCVISDVTDVKSWRQKQIIFCEFVRRLCLGKVTKYEGASLNFTRDMIGKVEGGGGFRPPLGRIGLSRGRGGIPPPHWSPHVVKRPS
jgi:fucose 4-O-acetylase-like acetyltransferase